MYVPNIIDLLSNYSVSEVTQLYVMLQDVYSVHSSIMRAIYKIVSLEKRPGYVHVFPMFEGDAGLLDMLARPLEEMPLRINDNSKAIRTIANFRLQVGH